MTEIIPQNDIRTIWSDVWFRTANEWQTLPHEEHLKLIGECWEVYDVQDKIYQGRANLEDYRYLLDTPAERFMDNVAIPLLTVGSMFTPATAPAALAGVARTAVAVTPRLMQVATALGAAEVCQEMMTFFSKKAGGDPKPRAGSSDRVNLEYGKGKFWESLITKIQDSRLISISRKAKADIRMDKDGFFYKFDPFHKTTKVHLHKYRHLGGDRYRLVEEVNPATGESKAVLGGEEIW